MSQCGRDRGRGRHSDPSHASYAPLFNRGGGGNERGSPRKARSQSSRQWWTNYATIITDAPQTSFQFATGPSQRRPEGMSGYCGVVTPTPTPTPEPRTNNPRELVPAQASSSFTHPDAEAPLICEMEKKLTLTALTPTSSKAIRFPPRPSFITLGEKIQVRANHFLVEVADRDLHHYDVSN